MGLPQNHHKSSISDWNFHGFSIRNHPAIGVPPSHGHVDGRHWAPEHVLRLAILNGPNPVMAGTLPADSWWNRNRNCPSQNFASKMTKLTNDWSAKYVSTIFNHFLCQAVALTSTISNCSCAKARSRPSLSRSCRSTWPWAMGQESPVPVRCQMGSLENQHFGRKIWGWWGWWGWGWGLGWWRLGWWGLGW